MIPARSREIQTSNVHGVTAVCRVIVLIIADESL
jgi:hypothetical protein